MADGVFDAATIVAFLWLLALIWTLSLAALQGFVTFALLAFVAAMVANRLDRPQPRPGGRAPRLPNKPAEDTISEPYGETRLPL